MVMAFSMSLSNRETAVMSDIGEEGVVLFGDNGAGVEEPNEDVCQDPSEKG